MDSTNVGRAPDLSANPRFSLGFYPAPRPSHPQRLGGGADVGHAAGAEPAGRRADEPGVAAERIASVRDRFTFEYAGAPAGFVDEFRQFYGPTMNAFAAAEKNGKAADLQRELEALFASQNRSPNPAATSITATFLRVTVSV